LPSHFFSEKKTSQSDKHSFGGGQKNEDHFLTPTNPQNGVEHICFMRLALLGGF